VVIHEAAQFDSQIITILCNSNTRTK